MRAIEHDTGVTHPLAVWRPTVVPTPAETAALVAELGAAVERSRAARRADLAEPPAVELAPASAPPTVRRLHIPRWAAALAGANLLCLAVVALDRWL